MVEIHSFHDKATGSFTHLVVEPDSKQCVVIDPVLAFDITSSRITDEPLRDVVEKIITDKLDLVWIMETHAHADHLTACRQLKQQCGGKVVIGKGITSIQKKFKDIFCFDDDFSTDGDQFDVLLTTSSALSIGHISIEILSTPGHTLDSCSYKIEDNIFIGDTLFHPSIGTARCDFPGGDPKQLFESIQKLLSYPDSTLLYLCHDYPSETREATPCISIAEMKKNIHLIQSENTLEKYVAVRSERDKQLPLPKLIIPSLQVNISAGIDLCEGSRPQFLKWPVNIF